MRSALRVLASLNALFQVAVGLLCIFTPIAAAKVFQLGQIGPSVYALTRMFGGLIFGSGLLSALVARDPDRNPDLPLLLVISCVANVGADAMVVANGEMLFGQVAVGVFLQVVVVGVAVAYLAARKKA